VSEWDIVRQLPQLVMISFGIGLGIGWGSLSLRNAVDFFKYVLLMEKN